MDREGSLQRRKSKKQLPLTHSNIRYLPKMTQRQFLDEGKCVDVTHFDYAKAFDMVSHGLLIIISLFT